MEGSGRLKTLIFAPPSTINFVSPKKPFGSPTGKALTTPNKNLGQAEQLEIIPSSFSQDLPPPPKSGTGKLPNAIFLSCDHIISSEEQDSNPFPLPTSSSKGNDNPVQAQVIAKEGSTTATSHPNDWEGKIQDLKKLSSFNRSLSKTQNRRNKVGQLSGESRPQQIRCTHPPLPPPCRQCNPYS